MSGLFDHRMIIVGGKGGVGRSTVAASLGLAAAKEGKRAIVAEIYGQAKVAHLFGLTERSYTPRSVAPNLDVISITVPETLDDFGHRKLKMDALVRIMFNNRVVTAFIDAVPGLHDLLQLGKLENMLMEPLPDDPHYDIMILDGPATGHGLTLLSAARSMSETSRVGPFHDLAAIIEKTLGNPALTALVLVTLAEELPVNETLEFIDALGDEQPLLHAAIVNRTTGMAFAEDETLAEMHPALERSLDPDLRELGQLVRGELERQTAEQQALEHLRRGLAAFPRKISVVTLPTVPDLDAEALAVLSEPLRTL